VNSGFPTVVIIFSSRGQVRNRTVDRREANLGLPAHF